MNGALKFYALYFGVYTNVDVNTSKLKTLLSVDHSTVKFLLLVSFGSLIFSYFIVFTSDLCCCSFPCHCPALASNPISIFVKCIVLRCSFYSYRPQQFEREKRRWTRDDFICINDFIDSMEVRLPN